MDPLLSFKAFIKVAETGSFSEAARRIGVATSVVKKRVDQLESSARVLLIRRSTRRIELTEAGQSHLAAMRRAVHGMDQALAGVQQHSPRIEGRLRIKAPTTLTDFYLGDVLARFQRAHPAVALELIVRDGPVDPVLDGFDIAISMSPGSFAGVTEFELCEAKRLIVAAPTYLAGGRPRIPQDLQRHDVLGFVPTGSAWHFGSKTGPIVVTIEPRFSSNDGRQVLRAALMGHGIACLSEYLVAPAIERGDLVTLLEEFPVPDYWIRVQGPDAQRNQLSVQALVDCLKAEFTPSPPWRRAGGKGATGARPV